MRERVGRPSDCLSLANSFTAPFWGSPLFPSLRAFVQIMYMILVESCRTCGVCYSPHSLHLPLHLPSHQYTTSSCKKQVLTHAHTHTHADPFTFLPSTHMRAFCQTGRAAVQSPTLLPTGGSHKHLHGNTQDTAGWHRGNPSPMYSVTSSACHFQGPHCTQQAQALPQQTTLWGRQDFQSRLAKQATRVSTDSQHRHP
jgi:hypothetical protein